MRFGSSNVRYLYKPVQRLRRTSTLTGGPRYNHSQVLEHLGEPEALHVIDKVGIGRVDIVDRRERDCRRLEERREAVHRGDRAVEVLRVPCGTERIEVGLEHLGAHEVV